MKILITSTLLLIPLVYLFSQKEFLVKYTNEEINLDGILDERIWQEAGFAEDFIQNYPTDTASSLAPTTIYMTYDDENLYVAAECKSIGDNYVVHSLRRDFRARGRDNLTLIFNPFNDGTNAFFFGTNPLGTKREGLIANGGNDYITGFVTAWDNVWRCESKIYDDHWIVEMSIPFSSLRFNVGSTHWGFNSYRFDTQTDERSTWIRIPQNQNLTSLAHVGNMIWAKPLKAHSSKVTLIPYVTGGIQKDFEESTDAESKFDVGGDIKVNITTGLNLDMTVNPDFSQVEVDQQITNIDRFEIFFPERRQFFIENSDLFASYGFQPINPFFSRRIGVTQDTSTGSNVQNRIYGGARLSGKLNDNLRLGVLNMQTAKDESNGLPGFNYSVTSVQQKLWNRSNLSFIFVNKQAVGSFDESLNDRYNRVAGMDFNFANESNSLIGKTFYHHSFNQGGGEKNFAHGLQLTSNLRHHEIKWQHEYVGESYDPQVGFVRRNNYFKINPSVNYKIYRVGKKINEHRFGLSYSGIWEPGFRKTDQKISLSWHAQLPQFSSIFLTMNYDYVYLFDPFDPTGTDSEELPQDTDYNYVSLAGNYSSNQSNPFQFEFSPYLGKYFNGFRFGLKGAFNYRYQPYFSIGVNYNFNHFDMPHLDETRRTYLFGPRVDLTFSKSLFLTAFVQYNSQFENTNINARFQWRFAPVSDFFIVYTDNYFTGNTDDPSDRFAIEPRNRAIVAKFSYWLNL